MSIANRAKLNNGILEILFDDTWRNVPLVDYADIEIISSGANGVTVSGIHKRTLRKDCIKIYTPNKSAGRHEVSIDQYLKEVRKLASLKNHHIVTVYDAFDVGDIHFVGGTDYYSETDESLKQIMYDALRSYMGDLLFEQELWVRINERRWKRVEDKRQKNEAYL